VLYIFLYTLFFLVLAFFMLPLAIDLGVDRRLAPPSLRLRLDGAFLRGLAGISLRYQDASWSLFPLVLGQPLRFLPLRSGKGVQLRPTPPAGPEEREEKPAGPRRERWLDWVRWFLSPGLELLGNLPGAIGLKKLRVCGRFGCGDPAVTGSIFGYLQSLKPVENKRLHLDVIPDFARPGLQGSLHLKVHLHLGYLLLLALRFALWVGWRWAGTRLSRLPWKPGFI